MRFLVVIIFLFNGFLSAQVAFKCPPKVEYDYFTKFEHFTTTKGLSNNDVTAIIQDNTGFLWFGTTDGLNRFDGYKFTVYKVNPKDTNSLSCNEITSLAVDKYNNIWIGTRNGLNKFNPSENKFTRYTYDENKRNTITNNWVRALYAGKDNYLYLETTDGTFHKYDIEKNIFKYYKHTGGENSNYSMHQIYEDKEGIIWAGGANSKLIKYEKKADKIKEFDFGACSFLEDDFGNFYLANQGGIIHLMDKNTFQRKEIPLTSIYSVIEDSDKNIWFGGYGSGAVRYSVKENKMTIYKYVPNNPYSIISDGIFKIYQDRSGVIWFATHLGLSKLSFTKYKFNHYFHIDNCNKTATSNRITAAIQENDSILWLGTWDSGLDKYNRQTGIFTNYNFDPNNKNSISSKKVSGIALDRNNNDLWISVWNGWDGAINKFNRNNETFTRYNFGDPWLSDVLVTRSGNVWSVGWGFGAGFSLLDKTKKEPTLHFNNSCVPLSINFLKKDGSNLLWFDFGFFDLEKNQFFNFKFLYDNIQHTPYYIYKQRAKYKTPNNIIIDKPTYEISELVEVIKGDENYTWLAFRNGLVLKYDCKAQTFSPFNIKDNIHCACVGINKNFWIAGKEFLYSFSYEKNKPEIILKNSDIKQIYEDQSGFLWIATSNQIIKFNKTTSITKVVANISNAVILPYDDDKRLMFFSKEKILVKNKSTDETVENNAEDLWKTLGDAAINKVKFFRDEILFIGTSNGLFIYNFITRKTSKYKYSPKDRTGLQGNDIRAIEIDKRGKIWLGTEKGLILFDYAKNIFVNYFNIEENCISSVCTTCALEDNEGNVWLGTSINGLNKINFKTNKIDHYCFLPYDSTSLSDKMVSCLFQDSRKNIWVGTDNGLNRLDSLHKKFKRFTTSNGFPSDKISGILEDNRGFLWISTANGLVKFDPVTEKIIYIFTKKEGLQDNEFSSACCKLKSGELLFGGFNGFNIFHPDKIQFNKLSPQIGISAFYINDSLSNIPNDFRSIELSYFQNNISFEFTAFDYNDPENLKYAYILEGFDEKWHYVNSEMRFAKYTNIPNGEYIFKIKASNLSNAESKNEFKLFLRILPPWWKTWWFRILATLVIISVVFSYIKWRERKLKKEKEDLEEIVKERTQELREANEELNQQNEEIAAQRDSLEFLNKDLEQKNAEITAQRDEIEAQRDLVMTQKNELEKLSIVASETDNSIIICDADGRIEWVNKGFERLYGISFAEFTTDVGKKIYETSTNPEFRSIMEDAVSKKKSIKYDSHFINKAKEIIWVQTTLTPIFAETGEIKKLVAIESDISEVKKAEEEIRKQHKEITDSINYAKRLQTSALPNKKIITDYFNDTFILFKPKDVVSGDFYWFAKIENQLVVAVADCTGHGVPGAFMSMLGMSLLKEIVVKEYITQPDIILKRLRKEVIKALRQTGASGEQKDGMDISLCTINTDTFEMQWAGANNSCIIIKTTEINGRKYELAGENKFMYEIKADKMPIAIYEKMDKFTLHEIQLSKGDVVYLYGDGYHDQFGGPKGKKFMSKRLKELFMSISDKPLKLQQEILDNTLIDWMNACNFKYEQTDDITILGVKI